jgi:hypothetical protein
MAASGLALSACGRATLPPPTGAPDPTSPPPPRLSSTPDCSDPTRLGPIAPPRGQHYSALVPDTLDLQPRAELVLQAMTNCTDPEADFAPYDSMNIWANPPVLHSTTMANGKYMEAAALLRHMTGSEFNQHVDQSWRTIFLQSVSDYPWWGIDGGRLLAWLGDNYRIEGDPCWKALGTQSVRRLSEMLTHEDDYAYSPGQSSGIVTGWDATWGGWVLQGLTHLHLATGDPAALDLAGRVARYLKDHAQVFSPDGHFLARHPSDNGPALHFHHNGNALEGLSAYALVAGDADIARFARSGYEWARSAGSPLVGFFPEYINDWPDDRPYVDCETCCTADMIQIAMNLGAAGQGDYWDDVDRYLRNQFAEMQLLESQWIDRMAATLPTRTPEAGDDADRVSKRLLGSFASWASANDWYIEGQPGTTFCCIGNAGRTLYYVWERMIGFQNGTLSVHLLLNRASAWADVDSCIPYEGRVSISMKAPCRLEVRIPEWVKPAEVSCSVNGTPRGLQTRARYVLVGAVEASDKVTMTFPIAERSVDTIIGEVPYALVIKGNEVVSIDPPGTWYPFYQRAHYREGQTRWVTRDRFVPD